MKNPGEIYCINFKRIMPMASSIAYIEKFSVQLLNAIPLVTY